MQIYPISIYLGFSAFYGSRINCDYTDQEFFLVSSHDVCHRKCCGVLPIPITHCLMQTIICKSFLCCTFFGYRWLKSIGNQILYSSGIPYSQTIDRLIFGCVMTQNEWFLFIIFVSMFRHRTFPWIFLLWKIYKSKILMCTGSAMTQLQKHQKH